MSKKIPEMEYLIDALKSLPGLGRKTATKWAFFLLEQDEMYIDAFLKRIKNAHQKIKHCKNCFNLTTQEICDICNDQQRCLNQLCIISTVEDLQRMEDSGNYSGLYFVLNGELSVRNRDYNLKRLTYLSNHIQNNPHITEVIIATNFSMNGELTSKKILEVLEKFNLKIYRIGFGLPLNSSIDYADDETIKYALINKSKLRG